jgi:excisionase family DNA binding protein
MLQNGSPPPQPLPTVAQLAKVLGVHPATVYRDVQDRKIAAIRIRNAIRIPWREYRRLTGDDTAGAAA